MQGGEEKGLMNEWIKEAEKEMEDEKGRRGESEDYIKEAQWNKR